MRLAIAIVVGVGIMFLARHDYAVATAVLAALVVRSR